MEENKDTSEKIQELLMKIYASILKSKEISNNNNSTWIRDERETDLSGEY